MPNNLAHSHFQFASRSLRHPYARPVDSYRILISKLPYQGYTVTNGNINNGENIMTNNEQTPKTASSAIPLGNASSSVPAAKHGEHNKTDQGQGEKLRSEIKKTWSKLSDDEVKLYAAKPDEFFGKLKEKHNVSKEDAQKRMAELKMSCGCGSEKAA